MHFNVSDFSVYELYVVLFMVSVFYVCQCQRHIICKCNVPQRYSESASESRYSTLLTKMICWTRRRRRMAFLSHVCTVLRMMIVFGHQIMLMFDIMKTVFSVWLWKINIYRCVSDFLLTLAFSLDVLQIWCLSRIMYIIRDLRKSYNIFDYIWTILFK